MTCLLGKKWSIRFLKQEKPLTNGSARWSLIWYPCSAGQRPPGHSCNTNLVYKKTSISNQNRRVSYSRGPRTSACYCAKARLMRVTHQEDKQTWENCGWVALKKENLKRWKVLGVSKLTYRLEKSLFKQQKENKLVITRKNNESQPNQKLTETSWPALTWQSWSSQGRRGKQNLPITELQLVKRRFLGSWKREFKTKSNKQTRERKSNEKQTNKQKKKRSVRFVNG